MKSQSGLSIAKSGGLGPALRRLFQERMFLGATPSSLSAVIISAQKSPKTQIRSSEGVRAAAAFTLVAGKDSASDLDSDKSPLFVPPTVAVISASLRSLCSAVI